MIHTTLLFLNIGSSEMILILGVALLLFGGEKLPELARGLGKGIRDFKEASEDVKREINYQINNYDEKKEEQKAVENPQLPEAPTVPNTVPVANVTYSGTEAPHVTEAEHANTITEPPAKTEEPVTAAHHEVAELVPEHNDHHAEVDHSIQHNDQHL
jgi:sec-independent protein translocase protein TatA